MKLSSHTHTFHATGQPAGHSHHSTIMHSMNQASCSTKHVTCRIGANCPELVRTIPDSPQISRIFKVAASEQLGYSKKLIKPLENELYTRETSSISLISGQGSLALCTYYSMYCDSTMIDKKVSLFSL